MSPGGLARSAALAADETGTSTYEETLVPNEMRPSLWDVQARPLAADPSPLPLPLSFEDVTTLHARAMERRVLDGNVALGLVGEMIDYHLRTGGKRMRAFLPVWVCINLGGRAEAAFDLGAGLELIHNATLVHDDLQDGDTHRRGRPTVWHRWGAAQAINAGDALIFQGFARFAGAPALRRVLDVIALLMVRVVEGQALDSQLQLPRGHEAAVEPSLATWEVMARGKTGALFAACMVAGAAAADASDAVVANAACFGEDLGLLFQVQDDYLDLVGDKGRERQGRDLMEGKLSFPVMWAYEHAAPEDVAPIRRILELPVAERTWAMADTALAALERCGALAATADWLLARAAEAERHPMARVVPGLVERCLKPVQHNLAQPGRGG
jgi:geranylgeranyl pyrophosphate synthase